MCVRKKSSSFRKKYDNGPRNIVLRSIVDPELSIVQSPSLRSTQQCLGDEIADEALGKINDSCQRVPAVLDVTM